MSHFTDRLAALNNAVLPGHRRPFAIGPHQVGWVAPPLAAFLADHTAIQTTPTTLTLPEDAAADLPALARAAATAGLLRWRNEAFDVRSRPLGPTLSTIDRGALPAFGIQAQGVHMDGIVTRPDGVHIWIARRAANKALDPGKLDHIAAGGIPAGLTPDETLIKESAEEADIPAHLAAQATKTATVAYAMDHPEGLRRDLLHCYELELPPDFTPTPTDGEVEAFELWRLEAALTAVRTTNDFKFNVNLVLMTLFLRHGLLNPTETADLRTAQADWARALV